MSRGAQTGSFNRRIVLVSRPLGVPRLSDFELVEAPIPEVGDGQVLLRNVYLSLDPATRGWMSESASYIEPIGLGAVVRSASIGEVVASRHAEYVVGDHLVGLGGWEEYSLMGPRITGRKIPPELPLPLSTSLGVLGGNGLTAYFGLFDIGCPVATDTVLVSAAAGGVGSIVGQLAKRVGCRVVGLAGSEEKTQWLTDELGFDVAINYRQAPLEERLSAACPRGVDVFFDNVGGEVLDVGLRHINVGARVVLCGAISQINAPVLPPGPKNYIRLLTQRATMRGFLTLDYAQRWDEASAQLAQWVLDGSLRHRAHIVQGLANTPEAFVGLFSGVNLGKLMVRLVEV